MPTTQTLFGTRESDGFWPLTQSFEHGPQHEVAMLRILIPTSAAATRFLARRLRFLPWHLNALNRFGAYAAPHMESDRPEGSFHRTDHRRLFDLKIPKLVEGLRKAGMPGE